jgi:hypothetical protein
VPRGASVKKTQFHARFDAELWERFINIADKERRGINQELEVAVSSYVRNFEDGEKSSERGSANQT